MCLSVDLFIGLLYVTYRPTVMLVIQMLLSFVAYRLLNLLSYLVTYLLSCLLTYYLGRLEVQICCKYTTSLKNRTIFDTNYCCY